ncbi:TPA: phage tail protein [Klebsiella pneumoniae]
MENKLPDISLPVWMNKGEPLTLAHASKIWWERVRDWLMFPLAQIDVDTCDEQLLTLLAYQRDVERFPGESLSLFRLRVKHAFVNAQDAGSLAGFARIFERLGVGEVQQLERQLQYDWDVIVLRINDEQLSRDNTLLMHLVRQYGRTCRRYFFDVLNQNTVHVHAGSFDCLSSFHCARLIPRPTRINVWPDTLRLSPGDTCFVGIEVLPADAPDLSWRAEIFPPGAASLQVVEDGFWITGISHGEAFVVITANDNGISKRAARTVLTGMCYSVGSATRQGSSSLTRFIGQSAMTSRT